MAEFKRIIKKIFSKCVAASGARFELDVEELWVSKYFRIVLMGKNVVKGQEKRVEMINVVGYLI